MISSLCHRLTTRDAYTSLTLVRDTFDVLSGENLELIEDYEEREREIDSLRFLIERQAGITLDSYKVAERLNLGRRQAVEYSNLARSLERMADHTHQMARLSLEDYTNTEFTLDAPHN